MNIFSWFKPKQKPSNVEVRLKKGKNDKWRWTMYVGNELYALCPVQGFDSSAKAKANAIMFLSEAGGGYKTMNIIE